MENVTPQQLGVIAILTLIAMSVSMIAHNWGALVALFQRYVVVNRFEDVAPVVTSSEVVEERPSTAVVSQTDSVQTDRQPQTSVPPREVMLDMYRLLRAHGVSREKARPVLKAAGFPLDNNLWAQAAATEAAPEDDLPLTPITRRPYDPRLYHKDDPALQYQPPE